MGQSRLPGNKSLSFNGKFITLHSDCEFKAVSENGIFGIKYEIGHVGDEQREIFNLRLFENDALLFEMKNVPGSDIMVSNAGFLAVYDMKKHFQNIVTLHFYNKSGQHIFSETSHYASLFGFSPQGKKWVTGTSANLQIVDLESLKSFVMEPCSQFSFSEDETVLATAFESLLHLYQNFRLSSTINTGLFYPRAVAVTASGVNVCIIGKNELINYDAVSLKETFRQNLPAHNSYRDVFIDEGLIYAGVHYKNEGISKGILQVYTTKGIKIDERMMSEKSVPVFEKTTGKGRNSAGYDTIPWPFVPFDEVHTIWNHYEQHMGYGASDWSYLHQGLDIITPINEPAYAVQEGWVKCVLTTGGDSYWRVAVCPEQSQDYADGWLYAHLVESSIQVDVGDYVQIHDYLGDIIEWSYNWGHIHFVNIHDQGQIWYYDDDEWGINFNPLLALNPIDDAIAPLIENFSSNSKFGFSVNQSYTTYLTPSNLYGEVDIIAKISDYHGDSPWEQPAFKTYYWVTHLPENTIVFPKTLGQILNHTYSFYSSSSYEVYAPLIYKMDPTHPSPYWMEESRDYFQVLTNNNGDSLADLSEMELAFVTTNFIDGNYRIFVEAWDEFGNMALDSQDVVFNNGITSVYNSVNEGNDTAKCYPIPASKVLNIEYFVADDSYKTPQIRVMNASTGGTKIHKTSKSKPGWNSVQIDVSDYPSGVYFYLIEGLATLQYQKFLVIK